MMICVPREVLGDIRHCLEGNVWAELIGKYVREVFEAIGEMEQRVRAE